MIVRAKCRKCGGDGFIDVKDMTTEQAIQHMSVGASHCTFGKLSHHEVVPPLELFEIDWDNPVEMEVMSEDMFRDELKSRYEEVLTKNELEAKYTVESFAFGACLCSDKITEQMVVFNIATSPEEARYYVR